MADIDVDEILREVEQEYAEDQNTEEDLPEEENSELEDAEDGSEMVTDEEPEEAEEIDNDQEDVEDVQAGDQTGTDEVESQFQTEEQNRAFADLRRQKEAAEARLKEAEANQKYINLLQNLAQARGMTIDQLYDAVEESRIEQAAKEQDIPVDVYRRLQKTESELETMRRESAQAKYFSNVQVFANENNLEDQEVQEVFNWLGQNGKWDDQLSVGTIPFDEAFYLMAREKEGGLQALIEKKAKELRQKELAAMKKRQRSTAIPHTGGQAPAPSSNEMSDDELNAQLKKHGLDRYFE